jgi:hypothetical protein
MCRRVECNRCHRPTFAGCGAHVEQVLGDVAPQDRCRCRETQVAAPAPDGPDRGVAAWLKRLAGK